MSFTPGTIVVQYVDDTHTVIGVVISNEIGLSHPGIESSHFDPLKHHILLVLGWHGYADSIPLGAFGLEHVYMPIRPFPHLLYASFGTAFPYDFTFEFADYERRRSYCDSLPSHPGLSRFMSSAPLPNRLLSFFPKPQDNELLEMVRVVQAWCRGATEFPPGEFWKQYPRNAESEDHLGRMLLALRKLLPRTPPS